MTLPWGSTLPPLGAIFCCPAPKGTKPPPTEPQLRMISGGLEGSPCGPREKGVASDASSARASAGTARESGDDACLSPCRSLYGPCRADWQECVHGRCVSSQENVVRIERGSQQMHAAYSPAAARALPEELLGRLASDGLGAIARPCTGANGASVALEGSASASIGASWSNSAASTPVISCRPHTLSTCRLHTWHA